MMNIALNGAEFFAYHGFYPEEQKIGCRFCVDVNIGFVPPAGTADDNLENTVDYERVYLIVCEEMKHTRKLIETVGQAIAGRIRSKYPFVENIRVVIKKLNPPLKGRVNHSAVTISYNKA